MTHSRRHFADDPQAAFYDALLDGDTYRAFRQHIPRSEVYYARVLLEQQTGVRYSLDHIEQAMLKEGFLTEAEVWK